MFMKKVRWYGLRTRCADKICMSHRRFFDCYPSHPTAIQCVHPLCLSEASGSITAMFNLHANSTRNPHTIKHINARQDVLAVVAAIPPKLLHHLAMPALSPSAYVETHPSQRCGELCQAHQHASSASSLLAKFVSKLGGDVVP